MAKPPGNRPPRVCSCSKQCGELFSGSLSLGDCVEGLLESLVYVVLDISECNPCIPKRHKEQK
jgi:hypothetical protein